MMEFQIIVYKQKELEKNSKGDRHREETLTIKKLMETESLCLSHTHIWTHTQIYLAIRLSHNETVGEVDSKETKNRFTDHYWKGACWVQASLLAIRISQFLPHFRPELAYEENVKIASNVMCELWICSKATRRTECPNVQLLSH